MSNDIILMGSNFANNCIMLRPVEHFSQMKLYIYTIYSDSIVASFEVLYTALARKWAHMMKNISEPGGIRTHELRNRPLLLYQLSYNARGELGVGNFNFYFTNKMDKFSEIFGKLLELFENLCKRF